MFPKVPLSLESPLDEVVANSLVGIFSEALFIYSVSTESSSLNYLGLEAASLTVFFSGLYLSKNLSATVGWLSGTLTGDLEINYI